MVRILQYIGSLAQGGSQAMIMNIYRNINRDEVQFDFVVHDGKFSPLSEEAKKLGASIYCCPSYGLSTAYKYTDWWKKFFIEHPEYKVVHSHVRSTAAIVLSIAKKAGCRTIAHSHNTSSGHGIRAVVKNLLQYRIRYVSDYFMGCSQAAGEWLFGKEICQSDRYFNVNNAIDTEKYIFNDYLAGEVRKELGYVEEDFVIGHVGRFSGQKNHSFLLDVFNEVHKRNPKYKLLLVGDGELRGKIEQKIQDYGLSDAVTLTGVRTDVNRLMMAMDMFVFPSLWEGLPVSVVEAQATGVPCLVSSTITKEVSITPLIKRIPLEQGASAWVKEIEGHPRVNRNSMQREIIGSGYDIAEVASWISELYMEM